MHIYKVVFLVLAVSAASGCSKRADSLEGHLAKADTLLASGDVRGAVLELKTAVQQSPNSAAARGRLGQIYVQLGDGNAGAVELEKAVDLGFDKAKAEPLIIRGLLAKRSAKEALERASKANEAAPDDPTYATLRAMAEAAIGDAGHAEPRFEAVLEKTPDNVDALIGVARIAFIRGDLDKAGDFAQRAVAADPKAGAAQLVAGDVALAKDQPEAALAAFEKATALNPYDVPAAIGKVKALLGLKKVPEAEKILAGLKRQFPRNAVITFYQGIAAYQANRTEDAISRFREVLSVSPQHPLSQFYLGLLMFRTGNYHQAEESLGNVIRSYPNYLPARKLLAYIELKQRKPQAALDVLEPIGKDLEKDAQLAALAGTAQLGIGQARRGVDYLAKASALAPDNADVKTSLALAKIQAGEKDAAVALLESQLEKDSKAISPVAALISMHLDRGDWDKAIAAANAAIAAHGEEATLYNALGLAYLGKKQDKEARESFAKSIAKKPDFVAGLENLALLDLRTKADTAESSLQALLKANPDNPIGLTLAGRRALESGKRPEAVRLFEQARAASGTTLEARIRLASLYLEARDYPRALKVAEEAAAIAPNNPLALWSEGHSLLYLNRVEDAAKVAARAAELAPKSPGTTYLSGLVAMRQGQLDRARADLATSLEASPDNADALAALVTIDIAQGNRKEAGERVARLEKLEGSTVRVRLLHGDLASSEGDLPGALVDYQAALDRERSTGTVLKLHDALLASGDRDKALMLLKTASSKAPDDAVLRIALAHDYQIEGRADEAILIYQDLLKKHPEAPEVLNNLASLKQARGDQDALDLAQKAYDLVPQNPQVTDTYGWILVQSGQFEKALKLLRTAADAAKDDPDVRYHYAVALAKSGQNADAAKELRSALRTEKFAARQAAEQLLASLGNGL
ncbi:MAG: PEP-CTERM system TPR-repeat protein PrsT [Gammaproteobacteria bacterium]|nr:PEP-CTERM system TPR-repeat protein PrsT [Gammaproteobacteria bacterium]